MVHSFSTAAEARAFYAGLPRRSAATMRLTQSASLVFAPPSSAIGHPSAIISDEVAQSLKARNAGAA